MFVGRTDTMGKSGNEMSVAPRARRKRMLPDSEVTIPGSEQDLKFEDPVDEMIDASFPASDPPSGWAGEDPRDVAMDAGDDPEAVN
jgi:hypothetical protein